MQADHEQNADLLWAIRGAGHFFGIVTKLVISTFPLSDIGGTSTGHHNFSQRYYQPSQAAEVASMLEKCILEEPDFSGHLMIMNEPPLYKSLVIALYVHYLGPVENSEDMLKRLTSYVEPFKEVSRLVSFEENSDESLSGNHFGDYKWLHLVGLKRLHAWMMHGWIRESVDFYRQCPDAKKSNFIVAFRGPRRSNRQVETSFGNEAQRLWMCVPLSTPDMCDSR